MTVPAGGPTERRVIDPQSMTSAFVPVLVLALVMLGWFVFQAIQMRAERAQMRDVMITQEKQMQESKKLRDSFNALIRGTAQLAEAGNPGARLIVDDLKKHGVPIPTERPSGDTTEAAPK